MIADTIRRYASIAVPRYTSYPTAAEFSDDVTAKEHRRWLRRLDEPRGASIYLHVPYCRELCHYCGCHAKAAHREAVIDRYCAALEGEIELVSRLLPAPLRISRLHWGGGTPSILGAEGLSSVLDLLDRRFTFEPGFEHAIELDPRTVDRDLARTLARLGVTRASLGVQDVNPLVQHAIGRIQPFEVVEAAVGHLRGAGIARLNFDLLYGLPLQTTETLERTCEAVAGLDPDRVACYGYAHLPARRANQRLIDEKMLPSVAERFEQAQAVTTAFVTHGLVPIGIDHFAKADDPLAAAARAGRLHRNFQGYTDDDAPVLLGFGASAVSRLPEGYVQNVADNPTYCRTIEEQRLASVRGCRLDDAERIRGEIIESLMCNFAADLKQVDPDGDFSDEVALLRPLASDGLLTFEDGKVTMTPAGRPVVRIVAAVFDLHRRTGGGNFSLAV